MHNINTWKWEDFLDYKFVLFSRLIYMLFYKWKVRKGAIFMLLKRNKMDSEKVDIKVATKRHRLFGLVALPIKLDGKIVVFS